LFSGQSLKKEKERKRKKEINADKIYSPSSEFVKRAKLEMLGKA